MKKTQIWMAIALLGIIAAAGNAHAVENGTFSDPGPHSNGYTNLPPNLYYIPGVVQHISDSTEQTGCSGGETCWRLNPAVIAYRSDIDALYATKIDPTFTAGFSLETNVTGQPSCTVANRGQFWDDFGSGITPDNVQVCIRTALGTYSWKSISLL